ncbi:MAG: putative menaquinol-cytochrome c reductase cytochrome b/c subunit [Pedosphaera sp.]|nr:putative menaquinol-cytochrome c reductase cytochrome b/c subunit [Pedosphaera sp.]
MKPLFDWLDQRTGFREITRAAVGNIPGGARWRYVWWSALCFCIGIQFITGFTLWLGYSPSAQTAWESVNYLQNQVNGGWLLRGLHHYTAQILPVLLALHLMQVIMDGAYKAPREVNFWLTIALMQVVLLMALTGYQLPWDQKGFWATKVAMNILGIVPFVGQSLQKILIGGPDYGHFTLTRFFAVHAGALPATLLVLMAGHAYLFRRHGFAGRQQAARPDAPWWPDQALRNAVACLAVTATLLLFILRHRLFGTPGPLGAELGAPADPSEPYSAARPEWYFLFLFQFLKFFPSGWEILGALVIPGIVVGIIFLMPFIGKSKGGHRFNLGFLGCLLVGIGWLTYLAKSSDAKNPDYQAAVSAAVRESARMKELAQSPAGIPTSGALTLLRNDPLIQGPKLFAKNCASCHRYDGQDGTGHLVAEPQSASDLAGFGSRAWLAGLLDPQRIGTTNYFGGTKLKDGKMPKFVKQDVAHYTPEQNAQLTKVIAAVSAEAGLKSQSSLDQRDAAIIVEGRTLFKDAMKCADCHEFRAKDEEATAPTLTGWASREWLVRFLNNPAHPDFYGEKSDRMPAFGEKNILSPEAIGLLADWLRGDWYEAPPAPTAKSLAIETQKNNENEVKK